MNKLKAILFLLFLTSFVGCWKSNWTDKERQTFRTKCKHQSYFDTNPICFTGFKFEEIDTIKIIEKDGSKTVDTIYIYPKLERSPYDKVNHKFWGSPNTQFNVKHLYEFYLGTDTPYILDNMEMTMWPEYTMGGEGWGCRMGYFTIDNKKFEHQGNIYFKKRGFKYYWE